MDTEVLDIVDFESVLGGGMKELTFHDGEMSWTMTLRADELTAIMALGEDPAGLRRD